MSSSSARSIGFVIVASCAREQRAIPDTAIVDAPSAMPPATSAARLEDECKHHDHCVTVGLFVDGPLRCCIACGPQAAANKSSAAQFIAACAKERATRECPVYDCAASAIDARCVGGHCLLAPRPR